MIVSIFTAYLSRPIGLRCHLGLLCLTGLLLPTHAYAIDQWQYKFDLAYGLRAEQLDWHIAGNLAGTNPNILSELTWRDINSHQAQLGFRFIGDNKWYVKGYTSQAWGFQGEFQDSDYNGDNRQLEFSRSSGASERGSATDFSLAFGQQIRIANRVGITPLIGYSSHRQHFTKTRGKQTLCDASGTPNSCDHGLGPITGLDSSFTSHWRGPWVGLDLRFASADRWTTYAEVEYHHSYYNAHGNWNLHSDLQHPISHSQAANGQGVHIGLGLSYALPRAHSFLNIGLTQKQYTTRAGTHTFHLNDGSLTHQQLNASNWRCNSISIGITSQY